jgi:hypothetical protein
LSLPLYPEITSEMQVEVAEAVLDAAEHGGLTA